MSANPADQAVALANLYRQLAEALVASVSELKIMPITTMTTYVVSVEAATTDFGRLIGQQARMHNACLTILRSSMFALHDKKVSLVIDCPNQKGTGHSKFRTTANWSEDDSRRMASLLRDVASTIFDAPTVEFSPITHSATQLTLHLNRMRSERDKSVCEALDVWITAVGRVRGRIVYLNIV